MKKRDIIGAAALVVGLGLAAERAIDTHATKEGSKKPVAEKILKPKTETLSAGKIIELANDPESTGAQSDGGQEQEDGGFGGEKVDAGRSKISKEEFEKAFEVAIPGIVIASKQNGVGGIKVGDYYLSQPDKKGNYYLEEVEEVEEEGSESVMSLKSHGLFQLLEDGTINIIPGMNNDYSALINCDIDSLPDAVREYRSYEPLDYIRYDNWIGDQQHVTDNENATVDDLTKAKEILEKNMKDAATLLSEDRRFINLSDDEKAKVKERMESAEEQLVELHQRIIQATP